MGVCNQLQRPCVPYIHQPEISCPPFSCPDKRCYEMRLDIPHVLHHVIVRGIALPGHSSNHFHLLLMPTADSLSEELEGLERYPWSGCQLLKEYLELEYF
jgi:hypothetical protein